MRFSLTAKLAAAAMGLVALCAAPMAQAHENVFYSVNVAVAPGVNVGMTNIPVYAQPQPVYVQPQPVYAAPAPVYVQSAPVYVQGPAYGARYAQPAWRDGHGERERMDRAHWQEARWHGGRGERDRGEARGHGGHHD